MQSTQKQVVDLMISPAAVLRHAAAYLTRYGWFVDGFYDYTNAEDIAFPPACVAGALRCAVFGRPIDSLYDEIIDPDHTHHRYLIVAAQTALADEVDPEWLHGSTCPDKDVCALEVISDWNDVTGRTLAQVLVALYSAADAWDTTHPHTAKAVRS